MADRGLAGEEYIHGVLWPPAAGKTFLVLDMALSIATGKTFHDHNVAKGTVFYIAGEGHAACKTSSSLAKETQISTEGSVL